MNDTGSGRAGGSSGLRECGSRRLTVAGGDRRGWRESGRAEAEAVGEAA